MIIDPPPDANVFSVEQETLRCGGTISREGDTLALITHACSRFVGAFDGPGIGCRYAVGRIELRREGERLSVAPFHAPLRHGCSALSTMGLHVGAAVLTPVAE